MEKTKILIVDDHPIIREALRNIIDSQQDMEVVGEAEDGFTAIEKVKKLKPDIVVLDISLPDISGLEVSYQIRNLCESEMFNHRVNVVILSIYTNEKFVFRALESGVLGYVPKSSPSSEILTAIRSANRGKHYLGSDISEVVISKFLSNSQNPPESPEYNLLTKREQEIFRLIAEGMSSQEIARFLFISRKTVEKHRANIMQKLGVRNLSQLLKYALKVGIIDSEKS